MAGEKGVFTATAFHDMFCTKTKPRSPSECCRLYTTIAMEASRLAKNLELESPGIQPTIDFPW